MDRLEVGDRTQGRGHPWWLSGKESACQSLGWEDLLEKEIATHSNILAWEIVGTEEPGN